MISGEHQQSLDATFDTQIALNSDISTKVLSGTSLIESLKTSYISDLESGNISLPAPVGAMLVLPTNINEIIANITQTVNEICGIVDDSTSQAATTQSESTSDPMTSDSVTTNAETSTETMIESTSQAASIMADTSTENMIETTASSCTINNKINLINLASCNCVIINTSATDNSV